MTLEQLEVAAFEWLLIATAVVGLLRGLIAAFARFAEHTLTKADDEAAVKLAAVFDGLASALDIARRFIPRVVVGPLPRSQPIASESLRSLPPPPSQPTTQRGPRSLKPTRLHPVPSPRATKTPPPPAGGGEA